MVIANLRKRLGLAWVRWRMLNPLAVLMLGAVVGIAGGLAYGWLLSPVQYTEAVPSQLEPRYQAEFVEMVAETYDRDRDLHAASTRLAGLGRADSAGLVREVEQAYAAAGYPTQDLDRLERLARDLVPLSVQPQATP
jgi:hypothetical protein